jgi:hypothetical protein
VQFFCYVNGLFPGRINCSWWATINVMVVTSACERSTKDKTHQIIEKSWNIYIMFHILGGRMLGIKSHMLNIHTLLYVKSKQILSETSQVTHLLLLQLFTEKMYMVQNHPKTWNDSLPSLNSILWCPQAGFQIIIIFSTWPITKIIYTIRDNWLFFSCCRWEQKKKKSKCDTMSPQFMVCVWYLRIPAILWKMITMDAPFPKFTNSYNVPVSLKVYGTPDKFCCTAISLITIKPPITDIIIHW